STTVGRLTPLPGCPRNGGTPVVAVRFPDAPRPPLERGPPTWGTVRSGSAAGGGAVAVGLGDGDGGVAVGDDDGRLVGLDFSGRGDALELGGVVDGLGDAHAVGALDGDRRGAGGRDLATVEGDVLEAVLGLHDQVAVLGPTEHAEGASALPGQGRAGLAGGSGHGRAG